MAIYGSGTSSRKASGTTTLDRSRRAKMEEANRLWSWGDGSAVKCSTGSVVEGEEFPEDFCKLLHTELNSSRHEDIVGEAHVTGRVFWSRQDDRISTSTVLPSISDSENVNVIHDFSPKVKDKIRLALGRILLHPQYGQSLVQFWAATKIEGQTFLSTKNQLFALGKTGRSTWGLCEYRMQSMVYKFYGDIGESGEELGLPGRVFLHKLSESTPDVQYYSLKEYPQRDDASRCQVRASWALPVFEHSSQVCLGVLELVSAFNTITDWHDKSFLHYLYNVLQELGLQSIDVYRHYEMKKDKDNALTAAFHELSLVLESVYRSHKLPLALTWVLCNACDALLLGQCSSEGREYLGAFKANDDHLVDFLIPSTGYHLRKGQVAERVLAFPNMLYCSDITQFSIAEYPLVPFARQCKLSGWFTICLRSSYTGEDVYILEFFLPASSEDNDYTLTTVRTILGTMKENSKTFKLASGEELGEVLSVEVFNFQNGQRHQYVQPIQGSPELLKNEGITLQMSSVFGVDDGMDVISAEQDNMVPTMSEGGTTKTREKLKKNGLRFEISLDDVLPYSALSRRDAARELNVSVSTLKRVCRKHGIHRWPPRDVNKEVFPLALPNVGDTVHPDSPGELELDATINGLRDVESGLFWPSRSFISAERSNSYVTCSEEGAITKQNRKKRKAGVRIEISLEDVLHCSKKKLGNAARELNVSSSTLKRVCRDYGIRRWPPRKIDEVDAPQPSRDVPPRNIDKVGAPQPSRVEFQAGILQLTSDQALDSRGYRIHLGPPDNINKVGAPQPLHVEHKEEISQLTTDITSNQVSDRKGYGINLLPPCKVNKVGSSQPSRVEQEGTSELTWDTVADTRQKPLNAAFQEMEMVAIKAKYYEYTIKFWLSMSSGVQELQQQVAKRLNLKAGTYYVNYKDEEELILINCDDDLQDCISTFRSLGHTTVPIVILPCSK